MFFKCQLDTVALCWHFRPRLHFIKMNPIYSNVLENLWWFVPGVWKQSEKCHASRYLIAVTSSGKRNGCSSLLPWATVSRRADCWKSKPKTI